jgi:hypothetical protein
MIPRPSSIAPPSLASRGTERSAPRRFAVMGVIFALALLPACSGTWKGLSSDASSIFGDDEEKQEEVTVEEVDVVVSIAELQQLLDEQGYDPGAVDGIFGDRTARAIRSYQANNGLKVTGRPSADLVERLRVSGREQTGATDE